MKHIKAKKLRRNREHRTIIFVAISGLLLFYAVFFFIPLIGSVMGSFYNWNPLIGERKFIGLTNYSKIITSPIFKVSLKNTVLFTAVAVIARTILGLLLAVGIVSVIKGRNLIRSFYFLPVVMPIVAVALVWEWMYHPRIGLLNAILSAFGIIGPGWLTDASLAMPSVLAMTIWKDVGYAIIIYSAAYLNIPKSLYEAASIDGANGRQNFFYITIPMLKPITIFIMITSLISYFQSFIQIFIMTNGGPGTSTHVLSFLIFNEAFKKYRFGYASALSVILFMMIILVTVLYYYVALKKRRHN